MRNGYLRKIIGRKVWGLPRTFCGYLSDRMVVPASKFIVAAYRIKAATLFTPFQKKTGLTDAPPPPYNGQATSVRQPLQSF